MRKVVFPGCGPRELYADALAEAGIFHRSGLLAIRFAWQYEASQEPHRYRYLLRHSVMDWCECRDEVSVVLARRFPLEYARLEEAMWRLS